MLTTLDIHIFCAAHKSAAILYTLHPFDGWDWVDWVEPVSNKVGLLPYSSSHGGHERSSRHYINIIRAVDNK